jgi:Mg2+ and Co2+ transporter CorA
MLLDPSSPESPAPDAHRFARYLTYLFNDSVMGAVAILALATAVTPVVFDLSFLQFDLVEAIQWFIVTLFASDYLLYFYLARDRWAFLRDPWRILDLVTIVLPVLTLIPAIDDAWRHTLALRLLRLARAFSFGLRATPWMLGHHHAQTTAAPSGKEPKSFLLDTNENFTPAAMDWSAFLVALTNRRGEWFDVFDVGPGHMEALQRASGIPAAILVRTIGPRNFPHMETSPKNLIITGWLPTVTHGATPEVTRHSVLLAVLDRSCVLTMATRDCHLTDWIVPRLLQERSSSSAVLMLVLAFVRAILDHNEEALSCIEGYVRGMEEVPMARSGTGFFQLGFKLRKDLAQIGSDMWRIKGILEAVNDERIRLPWVPDDDEVFKAMSLQAEFLYETASNLRENLISLIELHMSTVSFQMNRLMKLLAVVTALGLIPATVGGLLGMNVMGNPWPITLPQVIFIVVLTVIITLYLLVLSGTLD